MSGPAPPAGAVARDRVLFVLAAATGAAGWLLFGLARAAGDAFDHPLYWLVGLPASALALAALGYAGARGAWRWPFVVAGGQLCTGMLVRGGAVGSLFPLTLALFGTLAVVGLVPTYLGVGVRRLVELRRQARRNDEERARVFVAAARARLPGTPPAPPKP